jgi:hypothetical protein
MEREIMTTPLGVIERADEETVLALIDAGILEVAEDGLRVAE